jgi:diguanylate cyclase (GGDEF)-like protein/PAS domain S-box-containing protein
MAAAGESAPGREALYQSLVEDAFELIVTIKHDLTIGYANAASQARLGYQPSEMVGRSIVDLVHPEDFDRAMLALTSWQEAWGTAQGTSSFRVRHADGSWSTLDVTAATVSDGDTEQFAVYCRTAYFVQAMDEVLSRMLTGGTRRQILEPVLDVFEWRLNGTSIAIAWYEADDGHQFVSTGLPVELTGAEPAPGALWAQARNRFEGVIDETFALLDPARQASAAAIERGPVWIEPVADRFTGVPALISVWGPAGRPSPTGHALGMSLAKTYVELILRWTEQTARLEVAARTDALTGLANRRSLFEHLSADRRGGGALLFCDLDRFKPVNDEHCHHVGDEVLRQVADRIAGTVRTEDLVARTGGDEFVVLARGATLSQAEELADRITAAVTSPFEVEGHDLEVGISVGVAQTDERLDDLARADADRALLKAKARRRGD